MDRALLRTEARSDRAKGGEVSEAMGCPSANDLGAFVLAD